MAYFPFFVDLEGRNGLIIGGGTVALHKAEKLLGFGANITVVAPEICSGFQKYPEIKILKRKFLPDDLENMFFVIAATDNRELNRSISELCKKRGIPVNTVDDKELCSFIFPSLVKRGDLTIGISTGGDSPAAAVFLKEKINSMLPDNFDEILVFMRSEREKTKRTVPKEMRPALLRNLFLKTMEKGRPLTENEKNEIYALFGAEADNK